MTTRENPFSEEFLKMTPDERSIYLKTTRVTENSEVPEEVRRRFNQMHNQLRQEIKSSDPHLQTLDS